MMRLFSHRMGLKPVRSAVQIESMDDALRNALWNVLTTFYLGQERTRNISSDFDLRFLCHRIYDRHLNRALDTMDDLWPLTYKELRGYYYSFSWYEVYDFIEFIANNCLSDTLERERRNEYYIFSCNQVFEREMSAYRFIDRTITQISTAEEVEAIEKALENTSRLRPVNEHLKRSLKHLSDRKEPDYRNSIKESISAVESMCKILTGDNKADLGQAIKKLKNNIEIHPALEKAFGNLYGYTSDEDGIRHALMDVKDLYFEDAKFMLVSCSTFVSYLIAKSDKAGIKII